MYLVTATKRPGADDLRTRSRVEHLRFMIEHEPVVAFGGSFQAPDGSWGGMCVVLDLPSDRIEEWLAAEPYHREGVFETSVVTPFRQLIPEPEEELLQRELAAELAARRER